MKLFIQWLIEWPKREFEEFEDSHVEITIRVLDDGTREITLGSS